MPHLHYSMPAFPSLLILSWDWDATVVLASVCMVWIGLGPLFAGDTDLHQLGRVVAVLGSIDVQDWPEVTALPDYGKVPSISTAILS